jgi:hypothetical protein
MAEIIEFSEQLVKKRIYNDHVLITTAHQELLIHKDQRIYLVGA